MSLNKEEIMISVKNLKKIYNNVTVLDLPELEIKNAETFGLVGNNGAGKTTFFRLLLDLIPAAEGEVFSKGTDVKKGEEWKQYTGSYLDENFLIDFLRPVEYFKFIAELHHINEQDLKNRLALFTEFFNDEIFGAKKYIRELSKGNQQKVGIAAALMIKPEIVILDEPFANLDPSSQIRLKRLLLEFNKNHNVTMLISSHNLDHVTDVCERIVVIEKGNIIHDLQTGADTLDQLKAHFAV